MRASKSTSRQTEYRRDVRKPICGKLLLALLACVLAAPAASQNVRVVDEFQPGIMWGGRAVAVAATVTSNNVIVATESGGLFRSTDGGDTWTHLDALPPFRMFDVKYKPSDPSVVIATAMSDSRATNRGGIWRSLDGGDHWQRQPTVDPPRSDRCPEDIDGHVRASAYGIAFQPRTDSVYVGTDCGLTITHDLGLTWTHFVPDPLKPRVWSVAVSANGTIYVCGEGGARLSQTQGSTWSQPRPFQQVGACVPQVHGIDFSPEAQTVFITAASVQLFRCDASGGECTDMHAPQRPPGTNQGRPPMVRVSPAQPPSSSLDVYWANDGGSTFRQTCNLGPALSCTGDWGDPNGLRIGHSDLNDLTFAGRCPKFAATDGGVQRADCGGTWTNVGTSLAGLHALQIYDVAGQIRPRHTDLYIGTQDNNLWTELDDSTWANNNPQMPIQEGGGFQLERRCDHECRLIVYGATAPGPDQILSTNSHFGTELPWNIPPGHRQGCLTPTIISRNVYVQFSRPEDGMTRLYLTTDASGHWRPVQDANTGQEFVVPWTLSGCPQVSGSSDDPVLYQPFCRRQCTDGMPSNDDPISLWRIKGILSDPGVTAVSVPATTLRFGRYCMGLGFAELGCPAVFGASRTDPLRLIAPDTNTMEMKQSFDGGASWIVDRALTALITGQGSFEFDDSKSDSGARLQVHAIAFDPDKGDHIVVGTEAAGLIESFDGGMSWNAIGLSNQVTSVSGSFFKDDNSVIVSTYGRGLWRIHDCGQPCHSTAFSMSVSPGSVSIPANDSVSVHLSTKLLAGNAAPINLSFYVPRGVVPGQFIPTSVIPDQEVDLGFAVPRGTPPGPKGRIAIVGSNGFEAHSVTVDLTTTKCVPITCQADMCGTVDDKCGGTLNCGICPDPCRHCQTPQQCCICNGGVWVGGRCQ